MELTTRIFLGTNCKSWAHRQLKLDHTSFVLVLRATLRLLVLLSHAVLGQL